VNARTVAILASLVGLAALGFVAYSSRDSTAPELAWGHKGVLPGEFSRPRAIAIDPQGRLFIVDFTARIQSFSRNGEFLGVAFTPPDFRNGRPSGLGINKDGHLIVADSHYHTVRIYDAQGEELRHFGGNSGDQPGQLGYVSDAVQDDEGFYYVSEFGQNDRITKFDPDGNFVACWGKNGQAPGEFARVRGLALGPDGLLYAADACNHRIQVFTKAGEFVRQFGGAGAEPGRFNLPYDLSFAPGGELYVVERGNQRVQKLTKDGTPLGAWGSPGRKPGQLADPWAVAVDKDGTVHVVDTENHRIQRVLPSAFRMP
jgi:DNA-binding beta-propeller fold protein YncE